VIAAVDLFAYGAVPAGRILAFAKQRLAKPKSKLPLAHPGFSLDKYGVRK